MRRFVDRELIPIEMETMDGPDLKPDVRSQPGGTGAGARLVAARHAGRIWWPGFEAAWVWQWCGRNWRAPLPCRREVLAFWVRRPSRCLYSLNEEQKKRYLLPLIEGKKKTAFAQTEPEAGADPGSMRTTAVREGDVYVINGAKRFISFAADADFIQLVAATDRAKGSRGGLSVFLGRYGYAWCVRHTQAAEDDGGRDVRTVVRRREGSR